MSRAGRPVPQEIFPALASVRGWALLKALENSGLSALYVLQTLGAYMRFDACEFQLFGLQFAFGHGGMGSNAGVWKQNSLHGDNRRT
jgi:hypothetical protein